METPYDTAYLYKPIFIIDFIEKKLYKQTNKNTENKLNEVYINVSFLFLSSFPILRRLIT